LDFSRPGKPTDNAFIEAFNSKFRAECLNAHWFMSLDDARSKMEEWRKYYNEDRPHSGIGQIPPILLHNSDGASSPSLANEAEKLRSQVIQGLGAVQNAGDSNRHWVKLQWQVIIDRSVVKEGLEFIVHIVGAGRKARAIADSSIRLAHASVT
jgi:Integrase core domain